VGLRAVHVRGDLAAAAGLLQQLQRDLEVGDASAAQRTLAALQRRTRAAANAVEDPAWRLAANVPGPARNLAAVRTVATALDDLARDAMPPLVAAAASVGTGGGPRVGGLDLSGLRAAAPRLESAHQALLRVLGRIEGISPAGLTSEVQAAVTTLREHLARARAVTDTARRASALLPSMLGADGARSYLLLFQNPAEVRASGGMPGAFAVVAAQGGQIRLIDQGTASIGLRTSGTPVLPVEPEVRALYGDQIASHPANINMTPHFPTTAALAREMYRLRSGRTVDGVLATDPVALSYLLGVTGPIAVPGGPTLTADNAVKTLLADVYARFSSREQQDDYFARAARATFEMLVRRLGEGRALLAPVARATGERRILVWSAHPEEQRSIAGTALEGVLPADDGAQPTVGVFLNDGGASKLGYYLTQSADLREGRCRADGRRELTLRVTLGSTAPRTGLPHHVLSSYPGVADRYSTRTYVSVYSPTGWGVLNATLDGLPVPITSGRERGRAVALLTLDVPAARSRVLEVGLVATEPDRVGGPANRSRTGPLLRTTPMVTPWHTKPFSPDRCDK
jgi:hypothetical protein